MLALYVQNLDESKRFGPCTYPHVEISSKFEVLGPSNGRGRTSSKPLKVLLRWRSTAARTTAGCSARALSPRALKSCVTLAPSQPYSRRVMPGGVLVWELVWDQLGKVLKKSWVRREHPLYE